MSCSRPLRGRLQLKRTHYLLFGSGRERAALEAGRAAREIALAWEAEEEEFRLRRREFLLY